jgi:small-conductance mechanosensitive channel
MYAANARSPIEDRVPYVLTGTIFGNATWQWLALLVAMPLSFGIATLVVWILLGLSGLVARRTKTSADDALIASARRPGRLALAALVYWVLARELHLTLESQHIIGHLGFTAFVLAVAWFAFGVVAALIRWFEERIPEGEENAMAHRGARTRLAVFERVAEVLIVVVATAFALVQFEVVRSIGVSLLASAGIAGVVVGFAAQKSLGGIIAGVHLSITQPIRMGDSILIEGEFGTVEEINLTYVVVRLWDERRLVVPVGRFLDQPFQNWTKVGSELIGTVTIACDFGTPVERVRAELVRVCSLSPHWDRRSCSLQMTEAGERSVTLRAVMSSANASALWDLRCEVRERLVRFLLELEGGRYVARAREEWLGGRPPGSDGAARDDRTLIGSPAP